MDQDRLITLQTNNGISIVSFNSNAITNTFLDQLNQVLDRIETTETRGVVFVSLKSKIFLAGADLFSLQENIDDEKFITNIIEYGQSTFNRIEDLKIPTVAAINGACLGGGLELALACKYRLASNDKSTKLGLPEVSLGFLPAWGGTTRLPKITGLPNALKLILGGSQIPGKPAKKYGLVDNIVHKENLIKAGTNLIETNGKRKRKTSFVELLPNSLILKKARENVLSKTKGNYPAPLRIIEVINQGINGPRHESLKLELETFLTLSQTTVCRNLLRIFFLQEKSKKLKVLDTDPNPVNNVVVVGAGTMGAGIAQWSSARGKNVLLKDIDEGLLSSGLKKIGDLYVAGVHSHAFDRPAARDGLARVTGTTENVPLHKYDLLIEAIVEKLNVKQHVLAQLEEKLSNDAIIASNTSALSIDEMAECLKRPERFVGIHFFNPVHKMKLVEVVRGSKTSDETVQRAVEFVQSIGKLPIVVNDSPGFVVNRILIPYLVEAGFQYQRGAIPQVVDQNLVKWGMPMGPFRLMDEIGLDVCLHVVTDLAERLGTDVPEVLGELVAEGKLGKKSGEGFYTYEKGRSVKQKHDKVSTVDSVSSTAALTSTMIVEATKVLNEGVVQSTDDVDFAMIMGTGFAPFRGGPLKYKETV